jgi:two-component SAPR family response regulator
MDVKRLKSTGKGASDQGRYPLMPLIYHMALKTSIVDFIPRLSDPCINKKGNPSFDLVITDLIMPELNGKDFIKKASVAMPDMKVIYVSGYTDNHMVHDGMLEKEVNFLQKPYSQQMLARMVQKVLDRSLPE